MKLCELCEPVFQYVCRLNRGGRQGVQDDIELVRAEVNQLLTNVKSTAAGEPRLHDQYESVRQALVYFVDSMIASGRSLIAKDWDQRRLAYEWQEFSGDEKFWDMLEEALKEHHGEAATVRLSFYYTCLGLGFTGFYYGKADFIKRKMAQMSARLDRDGSLAQNDQICPEAYQSVDRRVLFESPAGKLIGIIIAVVGLVIVLFIMNALLYRRTSSELSGDYSVVLGHKLTEEESRTVAPAAHKEGDK